MLQVREPRFRSDLAVWVIGTDVNGNRFKQTAKVENISRRGGRLAEIRCLRAPGDLIQVEHRGRKADFRVIWIDLPSGRAGICCIEMENRIWGTGLPGAPPSAHSERAGSAADERQRRSAEHLPSPAPGIRSSLARRAPGGRQERRFPRHRCSGGVAATGTGLSKLWGRLTVIALGGCYIETISPFRPHTMLELLIGAYGIQVRVEGEVRYSQPGVGMGIMFTGMTEASRKELERVVAAASARELKGAPPSSW